MALQHHYTAKVYANDGTTLLKTFAPGVLRNEPTFRSRLNGGLGELLLDIALPFDDFDEGGSIQFMNIVDVYAIDRDNPRGRRIYRGFISRYTPYLKGADQGVEITCLGLASLLSFAYYANTAHAAKDPEFIAKAIIDDVNSVYTAGLFSHSGTTTAVGTTVTYTFTDLKWIDALKKTLEFAGQGYWWKIDADGAFHFQPKPSSATHTFTIGKDVESFQAPKDSERVANYISVVRSGGTTTTYTDSSSIGEFGRRALIITDSTISDAGTANQRGNKELADRKDEKVRATFVINAMYDLPSIEVGHTCSIRNFKKGSTVLPDNMQIVGLNYQGSTVQVELEDAMNDIGLALEQFVNG